MEAGSASRSLAEVERKKWGLFPVVPLSGLPVRTQAGLQAFIVGWCAA